MIEKDQMLNFGKQAKAQLKELYRELLFDRIQQDSESKTNAVLSQISLIEADLPKVIRGQMGMLGDKIEKLGHEIDDQLETVSENQLQQLRNDFSVISKKFGQDIGELILNTSEIKMNVLEGLEKQERNICHELNKEGAILRNKLITITEGVEKINISIQEEIRTQANIYNQTLYKMNEDLKKEVNKKFKVLYTLNIILVSGLLITILLLFLRK